MASSLTDTLRHLEIAITTKVFKVLKVPQMSTESQWRQNYRQLINVETAFIHTDIPFESFLLISQKNANHYEIKLPQVSKTVIHKVI